MKLERVVVDRYGPLVRLDEDLGDGVQLIHGPNESGKTLLVEALLELLTGERPAEARVDEPVDGFAVLRDGGESHRLDADRPLLAHLDERHGYDFTPAEFRNVFVVRNAAPAIREDGFYEQVTDRVTGLRADDIRTLMAAVREKGRLTETNLDISNDARQHGKAADQVETARRLREDVERYLDSADGSAERELFEARRRARELESTVEQLEAAREREEVEALRETVRGLRQDAAALSDVPEQAALDDLRRALDGLKGADADHLAGRESTYGRAAVAALLLAAAGAAALVVADLGPLGPLVPVAGAAVAAWTLFRWGRANRRRAAAERERAAALDRGREAGLAADSVGALRARVAELERERRDLESRVDQAVGELRAELDRPVDGEDPAAVADAAAARLDERERGLPAVDRAFSAGELAEAREDLRAAREERERLEEVLSEHRQRLAAFERRAADLDFERFTGDPLDLEIAGLESLSLLADRLAELVAAVERDAERARTAHAVLEEMAAEEGRKVESLFGADSRASELLATVTDGRYGAVRYDADAGRLLVDSEEEGTLPAGKLSMGARDQLFFGVRVGLAEQLLGDRGVLVLDDAFLASDPARLDRQVTVLRRLAAAGWQVLYLTAKEDAVERLSAVDGSPVELDRL